MKVKRLRKKLCKPEGTAMWLQITAAIACLAVATLSIVSLGHPEWISFLDDRMIELSLLLVILPVSIVLAVIFLFRAIFGIVSRKELRSNGIMTYEYLEKKGMLEAAAEEYFGRDRFVCRLKRKGWRPHRYAHRVNVLTPNFIFIMSDNIVLTYDEVKKARFLRIDMRSGFSINFAYADTFALQMADGTEIALFSSLLSHYASDNNKEMIRRQGIVNEVSERIRAKNPECEISRVEEVTRSFTFDYHSLSHIR